MLGRQHKWILLAVLGLVIWSIYRMKNDIDLMARTAYGEARGEGLPGMEAVMHVIMNRVHGLNYYGRSVPEVVTKDKHFSAWNLGDPNRPVMLSASEETDPLFAKAKALAADVYSGNRPDTTGGATHYHTTAILPYWAKSPRMRSLGAMGNHTFYQETA